MARPRAWRSTCSRARARRSGCTSTSSRARSTNMATSCGKYPEQPVEQQLGNPVHHIHEGAPPAADLPVSFSLLLNLASVAATDDPAKLWAYVARHAPGASPGTHPALDRLVAPRCPLCPRLRRADTEAPGADGGRSGGAAPISMRGWRASGRGRTRKAISSRSTRPARPPVSRTCGTGSRRFTKPCIGSSQGPRMGSFIALYGLDETRALIAEALNRAKEAA